MSKPSKRTALSVARTRGFSALAAFALTLGVGCIDRPAVPVPPTLQAGITQRFGSSSVDRVDILFEIDNSGSMLDNQAELARQLPRMIAALTSPTASGARPIQDLRIGVISSDLGTHGVDTGFGNCRNPTAGDDGLVHPFRAGMATQTTPTPVPLPTYTDREDGHAPGSDRACGDRAMLPRFLTFNPGTSTTQLANDFVCEAYLGTSGCGFEQQLESVYRALVVHDARERSGNNSPNAGFLGDDALLAIVMVTDEEDGSVVDCDPAHNPPGERCSAEDQARSDRIGDRMRSIYTAGSPGWGNVQGFTGVPNINARFYLYQSGTPEDPTWSIDRYIDRNRLDRGLLRLKPGNPERIIFAAVAGVPVEGILPVRNPSSCATTGRRQVDWNRLLDEGGGFHERQPGLTGPESESWVSMRQARADCHCGGAASEDCGDAGAAAVASPDAGSLVPEPTTRVVPACWRRNSRGPSVADGHEAQCNFSGSQGSVNGYFALPSRRIARVAQRFDELSPGNGTVYSVCEQRYTEAVDDIVSRIRGRTGRCIRRPLETSAAPCTGATGMNCALANCSLVEILPFGTSTAEECVASRGRSPGGVDASSGRPTCIVRQVPVFPTGAPSGGEGFYIDPRAEPTLTSCERHVELTAGAGLVHNAVAELRCVQARTDTADASAPTDVPDGACEASTSP